jgi:hypothetical protein
MCAAHLQRLASRRFKSVAAGLALALASSASTASVADLPTREPFDRLATFCTPKLAFGYALGRKPSLASATPEHAIGADLYALMPTSDWAPFDRFQAQITPRSGVLLRVYGMADLRTDAQAKTMMSAMADALEATGAHVERDEAAVAFEWPGRPHKPRVEGLLVVEKGVLTASCAYSPTVDQAMRELAPGQPRKRR